MSYKANETWWRRHDAAVYAERFPGLQHLPSYYRDRLSSLARVFVEAYQARGRCEGFAALGKALGGSSEGNTVSLPSPSEPGLREVYLLRGDAVEAVLFQEKPGKEEVCVVRVSWPFSTVA